MSTVRIAVVQSRVDLANPPANVKRAVEYLHAAAAQGARIVCLPETYPGPWTPPLDYDAVPALAAAARDLGIYVIAGMIEQVPGEPDRHHNMLVLLDPGGDEVGRYRRTTPHGPWIYRGGSFWNFHYTAATALPVFDLGFCKVGLLICSEVYVPELSRQLALGGAEIVFMPAGLWKKAQWDNWRMLLRARATENLAYTATSQNLLGHETGPGGLAMICSPESVVAESTVEGILAADCDLERVRFLREHQDGPDFPTEKACKAGVLWQWYLPDLYVGRPVAARGESPDG